MSGPHGIKEMTVVEITETSSLLGACFGPISILSQALQLRPGSFSPFASLVLSPPQVYRRMSNDNMAVTCKL